MAADWINDYMNQYFDEVSPHEFYRGIFPIGELEKQGHYEKGMYNAIAIELCPNREVKRYVITDGLEILDTLLKSDNFIIMSPISYAGKSRVSENARNLYAIAIDLDGVESLANLQDLWHQVNKADYVPCPTYVVTSGTGLHLYYVLEKAVPCFQNIVSQLSKLKTGLTRRIWNAYVTTLSNNQQIQSLFQGFRLVGGVTKTGTRTRAYQTGDKVSIEYLNRFVADDYVVTEYTYKSKMTLAQAKERYPEWYEKRVVQGQPKGTWICKPAVYEWWKRQLMAGITEGHRYYGMMCLAIYAKKCGVPYEQLKKDAFGMLEFMESKTSQEGNHFTEEDILCALEAYDEKYMRFPISAISKCTGIQIVKNKFNGQKTSDHLEEARAIRDIRMRRKGRAWYGRPPKGEMVSDWQRHHAGGTVSECARSLGISRTTVYKYWDREV